jgi:protein arginine kinase
MNIHEFLGSPAEVARREGPRSDIVMSSRVRIARNIKGAAFPGWAKKAERIRILAATSCSATRAATSPPPPTSSRR